MFLKLNTLEVRFEKLRSRVQDRMEGLQVSRELAVPGEGARSGKPFKR